ncbi:MAG: sulfatase family protein [Armatimonadota bacterium]
MSQPNILVLMTDQQYAGAMSCAGNSDLQTPAMDSLAAQGVRFDSAYCTYPMCIPARESLLTGRMASALGYRNWGDSIAETYTQQQLGFLVRDAGYDCVYGGKLHAPSNDATLHGFRPLCGQDDTMLAESCIEYVHDAREPFLLVASFDNPHNICEWARNQNLPWGNVPAAPTDTCPLLPANFAIPAYEPQVIRVIQHRDPPVYPMADATPDQWRQYRHAYYRLVEQADRGIERILDALHDQGLDSNTVILFTSDHGDGLGAHQWNQKSILYEECIRVPLVVYDGRAPLTGGSVRRELVSHVDVLPTVCDYAGIPVPTGVTGRSLRPFLDGHDTPAWRDEVVVETWPFQGDPTRTLGRMLRTARYKYAVYSWGRYREQLFDLDTDPGEMVNLAVSAKCAPILQEHRERLRRYCAHTGDEFITAIPHQ